jgi:hypothetical protein
VQRLVVCVLAWLVMTATLLVVPVSAAPGPEAEPVETSAEEIPMGSVADPAPDAAVEQGTTEPVGGVAPTAPVLTVTETGTDGFSLVGVTWAPDPAVTDTVVQVRVQDGTGAWGAWTQLTVEDTGRDGAAGTRGGTEPLWTGPSTGVEAELVTRSGAAPTDVQLDLVDPGDSPADTALDSPDIADTAGAAATMPPVYSRAQWGADESIRTWAPQYASTITAATIHHTADSNDYTAADVPAMLRSIYRYHAISRGWGDIGYNVIADKFGRLWEGRYGGLSSTVIGAHAGGFNSTTFGVSMLGNYDLVEPSFPMVSAVADVVAWKFSLYRVNPRGTVTLTSGGGSTVRWPAGTRVTLPTIFGHRDTGLTTCPGDYGYARLGDLRAMVDARVSGTGTRMLGNTELLSVSAQTVSVRGWTIDPNAVTTAVPVGVTVDGVPRPNLTANLARADVARVYPNAGPAHGFATTFTVPIGVHDVCVRFQPVAARSLPVWTCASLTAVHPDRLLEPTGEVERVAVEGKRIAVRGWTVDQDALAAVLDVHVYVNGRWGGAYRADRPSTAAGTAYAAAGIGHGFELGLNLSGPGSYEVCVYGINTAGGTINTEIGCETVVAPAATWAPIGRLESATVAGRAVTLTGWALDGDAPAQSLPVHLYVDGRYSGAAVADRTRSDIAAAHPGTGTTHGYTTALDVAAGRHSVCVFAINAGPGTMNPRLGCATVTVAAAAWNPFGSFDALTVVGGTTVVRGWVVDPDVWTSPARVHLYVDGRYGGSVLASGLRADVGWVHPKAGSSHGYTGYLRLARGAHRVCVYAINQGQGSTNPLLGCRSVTVP